MNENIISQRLSESAKLKNKLSSDKYFVELINDSINSINSALRSGGKIIICGNGGSASDALHFCGEIVGRFQKERHAAPAICLNSDVATMTAIANDYGYDVIFKRQLEAFAKSYDVFIGISTSGNSKNVLFATESAKQIGCKTIALLGKDGGAIAKIADTPIIVPSNVTARVQECHICIIHIICELVEMELI